MNEIVIEGKFQVTTLLLSVDGARAPPLSDAGVS